MATKVRRKKVRGNFIIFIVILILLTGIPFLFLKYQSAKSGMTIAEVIQRKIKRSSSAGDKFYELNPEKTTGSGIVFLTPSHIGQSYAEPPQISCVQAADIDKDGYTDVVVCDTRNNSVSWIRQYPAGSFTEKIIATGLIAPAHVQVFDFDKDGDNDLIIAVLGMLFPNNDKIGSVVILKIRELLNFKNI